MQVEGQQCAEAVAAVGKLGANGLRNIPSQGKRPGVAEEALHPFAAQSATVRG